jgi:5-methylcytosine-specific restriction endonuclease McrA
MRVANAAVLVLNQNYEPLNVCDVRRALGMLIGGKAEIVENGRGELRSTSRTVPFPSVIRLSYLIRRPRPRVRLTRREIFRRDSYTCQYCGLQSRSLTMDHVVPRHRGGEHSWTNLVSACPSCNRRKGGRTPEEARMALLHVPYEPRPTVIYLFGQHLEVNDGWHKFLDGWGSE